MVRWRNRLEAGEVLSVYVCYGFSSRSFYARYWKDYCITIPKLVVEDLRLKSGYVVEVTLYREDEEEDE